MPCRPVSQDCLPRILLLELSPPAITPADRPSWPSPPFSRGVFFEVQRFFDAFLWAHYRSLIRPSNAMASEASPPFFTTITSWLSCFLSLSFSSPHCRPCVLALSRVRHCDLSLFPFHPAVFVSTLPVPALPDFDHCFSIFNQPGKRPTFPPFFPASSPPLKRAFFTRLPPSTFRKAPLSP